MSVVKLVCPISRSLLCRRCCRGFLAECLHPRQFVADTSCRLGVWQRHSRPLTPAKCALPLGLVQPSMAILSVAVPAGDVIINMSAYRARPSVSPVTYSRLGGCAHVSKRRRGYGDHRSPLNSKPERHGARKYSEGRKMRSMKHTHNQKKKKKNLLDILRHIVHIVVVTFFVAVTQLLE